MDTTGLETIVEEMVNKTQEQTSGDEPHTYKVYYTSDGWICERYPYYFQIEDESMYVEVDEDKFNETLCLPEGYSYKVSPDGEITMEVYDQMVLDKTAMRAELNELEEWFNYYDMQSIQYARDLRLFGESSIDMAALDALAVERAARIKEIRAAIAE